MKTLEEYMAMNYPMEVIRDEDEGGYVISFPDLNGCITCAETIEAALAAAEDAKRAWIKIVVPAWQNARILIQCAKIP